VSLFGRISNLFFRSQVEEEIDAELKSHLEMRIEDNVAAGMPPEEARRDALLRFGNPSVMKERVASMDVALLLSDLWADVKFSLRHLRKKPGFTLTAVLTLALGIGANTAIFSVVEGVVLAPLPYPQPDRLVMVSESRPNLKQLDISYPDFQDWHRNARSFEQMAALTWHDYDLTSPGSAEHLNGMKVSAGFFTTLGVRPTLGRDFSPAEDQPHGAPAVVISNRLWKDRFASSAQALGKSVMLDGADFTVIGVLPPGFRWWTEADVYTAIGQDEPLVHNDRTIHGFSSVARLKPGLSIGQAKGEMSAIQENLDRLYPSADRNLGIDIVPLKQSFVGNTGQTFLFLLGAVGIVLGIACTNVVNLLLARSAARRREFAIRAALGASRGRMVRQLLTESVVLALAGGIIGLGLARLGVSLVLATVAESLPRADRIAVNLPVLFFAFGISLTVGILFGLAPALKSSSVDVQASLKAGDRGSTGAQARGQSVLIIAQVSLTLVLLVGAGLLLRTIRDLWNVDPGFHTQQVITFRVGLSPSMTKTASNTRVAYQQLLARIRQIPGIEAADFTNIVPLSERDNGGPFWVGAQESTSIQDAPHALYFETGPEYLQTMKIPLLRGRFFSLGDTAESEPVVVIDSVLAHTYFAGKDPVGQFLTIAHWRTARIIGVVGHVRHWGLDDPGNYNPSQIYISFYQLPDEWAPLFAKTLSVAVRTPLEAGAVMAAIKGVVYGTGKDQPVYNIQTMEQIVSHSMAAQRLPLILLGAFAILALLLMSVGIYGVISYSVTLRVKEIGIRMALGAERRDVLRMVIGQGLRLAVAGLLIGTVGALVLTRLLSSFSRLLYGVRTSDPLTFMTAWLVLAGVSVLACYLPARRASRIDPMVAFRWE
jgi:predicted permease